MTQGLVGLGQLHEAALRFLLVGLGFVLLQIWMVSLCEPSECLANLLG
jgi:hypothetical protein